MVTATQSVHMTELSACWGKPADHGLAGVLDPERRAPDPSIVLAGRHGGQLAQEALARTWE